jgi:hypothetical protein
MHLGPVTVGQLTHAILANGRKIKELGSNQAFASLVKQGSAGGREGGVLDAYFCGAEMRF